MSKKESMTVAGPFDVYPKTDAMFELGWTAQESGPLKVFRVISLNNTMRFDAGSLVSPDQVNDTILFTDIDVKIVTPKDGEGAYVIAARWVELGGKTGPDFAPIKVKP